MQDDLDTYYNALVEVCDADGNTFGAGVIVNEGQIVTCAHVVAAVFGPDKNADRPDLPARPVLSVRRPWVTGAGKDNRNAYLEQYFSRRLTTDDADLAVLRLKDSAYQIDGRYMIASFADLPEPRGRNVFAKGFPPDAAALHGRSAEAAYRVGGRQPNGWYDLLD